MDAADCSAYTRPQRVMDPSVYLDPEVFAGELRTVLSSTWQYACHVSELEKPGSFTAFEVADESLFALRGADGRVRTFYNVCMHRGHRLVDGSGVRKKLVCPYHAWTYRLDGRLHHAPYAAGRAGFHPEEICLTEVSTEDLHGFLFVNLDRDPPSMESTYPGIREGLGEFLPSIERMRPIERRWFTTRSNWKIAIENYNECYHCRTAHPSFSRGVVLPESYTIRPVGKSLQHRAESSPSRYYEIDYQASPHAAEYRSFYLWPLFSFQIYPGPLLNTFCWRPESVNRTTFFREWFSLDGEEAPVVHKVAAEDARTTVAEDLALMGSVQKGLASRGYRPGPLVIDPQMGLNSEHTVAAIKAWYREAMARPDPTRTRGGCS